MGERETISEKLFQQLRQAILSGEFEAGSQHSIYALAERFGVSRTPVRDAALRLADAGMVTIERNRGLRVRGIGAADIRGIFEMRLMLEVPAARAAASRVAGGEGTELLSILDDDLAAMADAVESADARSFSESDMALHDHILAPLDNERVAAQVRALREGTMLMDVSTFDRSRTLAEVHAEHVPIVRAIGAGDIAAAGGAMAQHLIGTALLLFGQVAERTGEALPDRWPDAAVLGF